MKVSIKRTRALALGVAALALAAVAGPALAAIGVDVNGQPVRFDTISPQRIGGRVFIPLRAVSEALGAEIEWDAATRTVRGRKGEREFTLPLGSDRAMVNGGAIRLDQPARIAFGTTMVPLRFVAEALGAEVEWNDAAQRVAIHSGEAGGVDPMPATTRDPAPAIRGEIVAIRPEENRITVNERGVRHTYRIDRDTLIRRGPAGQRAPAADLSQLRVGDSVNVRLDPASNAVLAIDAVASAAAATADPDPRDRPRRGREITTGEVVAVRVAAGRESIAVRTEDGRVSYDVTPETTFVRRNRLGDTRAVTLEDVRIGDQVRIRAQARTGAAVEVEVTSRSRTVRPDLRRPDDRRLDDRRPDDRRLDERRPDDRR